MSLKTKAMNEAKKVRAMLADKKARRRLKAEVAKKIKEGRQTLARLQKELSNPKYKAQAAEQLARAKAAYAMVKAEAKVRERQAVTYASKSPEKALVLAAVAGAAAGALLMALRRKR